MKASYIDPTVNTRNTQPDPPVVTAAETVSVSGLRQVLLQNK
jgi:hypothetical protein